jgi:hypothetical protein
MVGVVAVAVAVEVVKLETQKALSIESSCECGDGSPLSSGQTSWLRRFEEAAACLENLSSPDMHSLHVEELLSAVNSRRRSSRR